MDGAGGDQFFRRSWCWLLVLPAAEVERISAGQQGAIDEIGDPDAAVLRSSSIFVGEE
jgi:hypothetical protein